MHYLLWHQQYSDLMLSWQSQPSLSRLWVCARGAWGAQLPAGPLCLPSAHPSEKQQKAALEVIPDSCFHQKSPSLISGPAGEELSAVSFPLWPHRATPSFRSCFYPTKSCKPSHLSLGHSRCLSARTDVTPALLHHWQCVGCKIESIKTYRS